MENKNELQGGYIMRILIVEDDPAQLELLKKLLEEFSALMNAEKNRELLHTLRVYLENNMNYSLTAEKLYVNINTIRRRIEKVNELVDVDWNNYYTRAKIGLMLQFMQF